MAQKVIELPATATATTEKSSGSNAAILFIPKSVITELYTSGISVGTANTATNPLDVIKVRLQLARNQLAPGVKPPGMVATGLGVVRNEGVAALWSGLGPSLARGFFFGGARLGLYTPIKTIICGETAKPTLEMKVLSGSLSGGLAAAVTSPIELIKTRLQAAGRDPTAQKTSMGVIRTVVAQDGVAGLWKGAMPGLVSGAWAWGCGCRAFLCCDLNARGALSRFVSRPKVSNHAMHCTHFHSCNGHARSKAPFAATR
ncbi:hypothetical protein PLESTF_001310000 [Pleodorina starrii]|nr:hypothetical protein PLESTF_001310000 [Pleodorina starrii]